MLKTVKCSHCGADNVLTRDECLVYLGYRKAEHVKDPLKHGQDFFHCEQCGVDLTSDIKALIVPLDCIYMGIVCGYPCGRHIRARRVGDSMCAKQMPLGKLQVS